MSYAQIMAVFPGKKFHQLEHLQNSHGLFYHVWDILTKHYNISPSFTHTTRDYEQMAKLAWDVRVPEHHRAVLIMTFDHNYIKRKHFKRAAEDIRQFFEEFKIPENCVNHWPKVVSVLESNPEVPAIGFHGTSVACDLWDKPDDSEFDWSNADSVYGLMKRMPLT